MGKSIKKILKGAEKQNERNKECESEMEKSQEKDKPKVKNLWSKWSSLFSRTSSTSRRLPSALGSMQEIAESPQIMMNNMPKDMEVWSQSESSDINSQMLNIPIEPGRQVSTIILSPTKTGFKAVIAHYDVNSSLSKSLTKDFTGVSEHIANRRTLTLVFDMNQRTFEEIGVGKSECILEGSREDEVTEENRSISASAIYVRNDTEDLVESAAFLQARLSVDDAALRPSSLLFADDKTLNVERRHRSCRELDGPHCPGIAFKTISEPMWNQKNQIRQEMTIQQNVQEMLNQFIFLDRDESVMNYQKPLESNAAADQNLSMGQIPATTISSVGTHVAPDLLVNIKPFKEYVGSKSSIRTGPRMTIAASKKSSILERDVTPAKKQSSIKSAGIFASSSKSMGRDLRNRIDTTKYQSSYVKDRSDRQHTRSRISLCIRCGAESKPTIKKPSRDLVISKPVPKPQQQTTRGAISRNSLAMATNSKENVPCTLCSVWKMFKQKSSFTNMSPMCESFDDLLKEFDGYDHDMMFRQNMSQFKRKISPGPSTLEVRLDEAKIFTPAKEKRAEELIQGDMPKVTVRLIEFVRRNEDPCAEMPCFRKSFGVLETETITPSHPFSEVRIFETSNLVFTFRECNRTIRVMAQKIEENIMQHVSQAEMSNISQQTITTVRFPKYNDWPEPERTNRGGVPKYHSENRLEDIKKSFANYKRITQIPDVINQLLMDKVDDLRNELIMRMREVKLNYNGSMVSSHSIRTGVVPAKGKGEDKARNWSISTPTNSYDMSELSISEEGDSFSMETHPTIKKSDTPSENRTDVTTTLDSTYEELIEQKLFEEKLETSTRNSSQTVSKEESQIRLLGDKTQSIQKENSVKMQQSSKVMDPIKFDDMAAYEDQTELNDLIERVMFDEFPMESLHLQSSNEHSHRGGSDLESLSELQGTNLHEGEVRSLEKEQFELVEDVAEMKQDEVTAPEVQSVLAESEATHDEKESCSLNESTKGEQLVGDQIEGEETKLHNGNMDDVTDGLGEVRMGNETLESKTTSLVLHNEDSHAVQVAGEGSVRDDASADSIGKRGSRSPSAASSRGSVTRSAPREDVVPDPTVEESESTKLGDGKEDTEKAFNDVTTSEDASVHSCLTFFIPYVQQIQTAIEILNNVAYNFTVRKDVEDREKIAKELRAMRSYTVASDKKYLSDRGVESFVTKKCVEKNIANGVETSKTSRQITTVETSKSGNHLFVTNKKILTTKDRIKKRDVGGNGANSDGETGNGSILTGNHEGVYLRKQLSEESEDVNGVRFLYCNRSEVMGTRESSVASDFSYGLDELRQSGSSVIGEAGASPPRAPEVRLTEPEEDETKDGSSAVSPRVADSGDDSKVNDSLQDSPGEAGQKAESQSRMVTVKLMAKRSIQVEGGEGGTAGKSPSSSARSGPALKVQIAEENVIINESSERGGTPSVRVFKRIGKGIVNQVVTTERTRNAVGRELIVRKEEILPADSVRPHRKRMSVVIMLSKRKTDGRPCSAPRKAYGTADGESIPKLEIGKKSSECGNLSDEPK